MRDITRIVFHCSAGPQNQSIEVIKNFWKSKGWTRPGYHHIIDATGKIHDLQPIELPSNGVAGYNAHSIHISYLGGVTSTGKVIDNRTDAQKASQKLLAEKYKAMFPDAIMLGHRDFSPDKNRDGIIQPGEWMKACPCFSVKEWLTQIDLVRNPIIPIVKKAVHTQSGGNVNLRQGAGTHYNIIAPVANGTACIIIRELNGWYEVQINDELKGFIKAEFLK
ncbi:MAG: N-acetylmuramoyl-L-alanine amidase [Chitinophagales bacterium]|nr:N-acetylmuramoyl-L-alanine amidase [Chitinophagales bacterium]MBP9845823.1 N-acetylmuramoyl-L-alanine amidase [Saprospiraceae bacterium]